MPIRPTSRPSLADARLYGILDLGYLSPERLEEATAALIEGGADILQVRAKGHGAGEIDGFVRRVLPVCRGAGVPLIVNDHTEVAAATGADGVHLGQDDGAIADARARLAPGAIVGRSTHSPEQAARALEEGADYIGFGPLFATPTKPGRPAIGLDGIEGVGRSVGTRIPVFCIGGIKPPASPKEEIGPEQDSRAPENENLSRVLAAGARRVVIVSALLQAPDIAAATRAVKEAIAGRAG